MEEKKKGFFSRLVEGLAKTRENIVSGMDSIFSGFSAIDDDFYEELEETLIMGDMGIQTTMAVIEDLKKTVKEQHIKDPEKCREALINSIRSKMDLGENAYEFENRKSVVLVIGVNGVGKTTSIGKLADQLKTEGKKVVLAAADTFRAAAIDQLAEWANRAGVELIAQKEGSDPAAVIYDAIAATKSRNADVLICDTAGRLHNKKNLMEELKKINRIIDKEYPEAYRETLVVLDGTTGQNALVQARQFMEAADITGIILTKLDGTAKGGRKAMLNISGISEGVVLDHIQAGKSMDIYRYLRLGELDCTVAIIKNAKSNKMGRKDIIKIEGSLDSIDLDILGYIDHNITVNIIRNDKIAEKRTLHLPKILKNVIHCKNPRCITSIEQELPHIFYLDDKDHEVYRCRYCDEKHS